MAIVVDNMIRKYTGSSDVVGGFAAPMREVRQGEKYDQDESALQQPLPSLPALCETSKNLEETSVGGDVFDASNHIFTLLSFLLAAKTKKSKNFSEKLPIRVMSDKQKNYYSCPVHVCSDESS